MEKSSIVKGNGSYHHSQLVKMNIQAMFCPSPKFPHSLVDEVLSALKRPGPLSTCFQWVPLNPSVIREKFPNRGFLFVKKSLAGSEIQAIGTLEFENGLRTEAGGCWGPLSGRT